MRSHTAAIKFFSSHHINVWLVPVISCWGTVVYDPLLKQTYHFHSRFKRVSTLLIGVRDYICVFSLLVCDVNLWFPRMIYSRFKFLLGIR